MSKVEGSSEFHKFMRHFCSRLVQSTVQARMDQLVSHPCRPNPDSPDWFNVVVDEIGEVAAYLKSNIKRYPPNCPALTLDFLLHTADGDQLPLESWIVRIDKSQTDENINVHTTLYNLSLVEVSAEEFPLFSYHQMSMLLKSVVMVSRFTPTYRYYVRKQSPDTFVIFYKIYEGEADLSQLGEGHRSKRIGCLPTPFGTIHLDLHYRMKMELLPAPFVETTNQAANVRCNMPTLDYADPTHSHLAERSTVLCAETNVNAVPCKGSETIVLGSPVSGDVNLFSASPVQRDEQIQGLPFAGGMNPPNMHSRERIGRSASSTIETGVESGSGRHIRRSSTESTRSSGAASPHAPSSFPQHPQRAAIQRQLRIRNHSFPFASLLIDSQTEFEPVVRSQLLPKVPEDSTIPHSSMSIHASQSDRALERGAGRLRTSSSLSSDILSKRLSCEEAGSIKEEEEGNGTGENATEPVDGGSRRGRVIFACSPSDIDKTGSLMDEQERTISERVAKQGSGDNLMDEDKMTTSDDSFVKVIAFASSEDDLGSDLSEFVKEIRLAPAELRSFAGEETNNLSQELDHLRGRVDEFDTFVSTLKEMNSEK